MFWEVHGQTIPLLHILYPKQRELLEENLATITSEILPLDKCLGRILSSAVKAYVNDPPFDNSSMDGFAVIYNDTLSPPTTLSIIGQSMAGKGDITASMTNSSVQNHDRCPNADRRRLDNPNRGL